MKRIVLAVSALIALAVPAFVYIDYQREPTFLPEAPALSAPVTVGWGSQFATYDRQIRDAIAATNDEVGCIVLSPSGTAGTVTLLTGFERNPCPGKPLGPRDTAAAFLCPDGTVDIHVQRLGDIAEAYLILRHELGHALGLAHDPGGLMAPKLVVTTPLDDLSRKDRRALRGRLCR